jgi:hypothetical protein
MMRTIPTETALRNVLLATTARMKHTEKRQQRWKMKAMRLLIPKRVAGRKQTEKRRQRWRMKAMRLLTPMRVTWQSLLIRKEKCLTTHWATCFRLLGSSRSAEGAGTPRSQMVEVFPIVFGARRFRGMQQGLKPKAKLDLR